MALATAGPEYVSEKELDAPACQQGECMKNDNVIDLDKQLRDLLKKEETMAFFDFELKAGTDASVSGVCKISKPKKGQSKSKYLAVLFIMDTPNEVARKKISAVFNSINWDMLKMRMPGFKSAFPIPYMTLSSEIYFMETDIYLANEIVPDQAYISSKLFPALTSVMGMKAGELVFWEESDPKPPSAEPGLIHKIKTLLG